MLLILLSEIDDNGKMAEIDSDWGVGENGGFRALKVPMMAVHGRYLSSTPLRPGLGWINVRVGAKFRQRRGISVHSRPPGANPANPVIPLYEWPTIRREQQARPSISAYSCLLAR
jgi:hypothetical protein